MTANYGFSYYKNYFKNLQINRNSGTPKISTSLNEVLQDWTIPSTINHPYKQLAENPFFLTTVYPGLLIGSGYLHQISGNKKDENNESLINDEFKLGFYFDHTSGLPVIPGSSIKGVLRSAFKRGGEEYIKDIINDLKIHLPENYKLDITDIEKQIFENKNDKSIYERDIFFDAYPVSATENKLFGNDYITHHENPLKNPNPVQFLKVLPGVLFQFNFKLTKTDDVFTAENKKLIFKQIIIDLGLGAKTNVGYGQFEQSESDRENDEKEMAEAKREQEEKNNRKFEKLIENAYAESENNNLEQAKNIIDEAKTIYAESVKIEKCIDFIDFKNKLNDANKLFDEKKYQTAKEKYELLKYQAEDSNSKKHAYFEEIKTNIDSCEKTLLNKKLSAGIPTEKILNINNLKLKAIKQNIKKFTDDNGILPEEYHKQLALLINELYDSKNDKEKKAIGITSSKMQDCKLWDEVVRWVGNEKATKMYNSILKPE